MENNLKKCPQCGWEIARVADECPNCNYNFSKTVVTKKSKLPQTGSGIAGMVFGILALLLSCTAIGAPIAIFGIIFSCVGLGKKYYAHGTAIAGLTTSIVAIVLAMIMFVSPNDIDEDQKNSYVSKEIGKSQKEATRDKKKEVKKTPKPTKRSKTAGQKKNDYIKSCATYKYKSVLRNPDKYIGKRAKVKLKISSVHEESWLNSTKYYFAYSNDKYDMWCGNEYVIFDTRSKQKPKLLEDDIIEVYGEIAEPEDTISLIAKSSEVFSIKMKYVKLISE